MACKGTATAASIRRRAMPLPASPIGYIHAGSRGGPPGQLGSSRKRSMPQRRGAQHRARLSAPDNSRTHRADCRSRNQPIPILEDRKIDWLDCLAWRTAFPLERISSNSAAANIRSGPWIDLIGGHLKFQTIWNSGADGGDAGIRTRGTLFRVRRFSKPLVSATHPRLRDRLCWRGYSEDIAGDQLAVTTYLR